MITIEGTRVQKIEKRSQGRVRIPPSGLEIRYSDGTGVYREFVAQLLNLDHRGLGVSAEQALRQHSQVSILMKWEGLLIEQKCSVRWCRPTKNGHYRIGLNLLGIPRLVGEDSGK